jgi:type IV secretory pathway VirB10-like protein
MNTKKSILLWGCLALLFLAMIYLEIKQDKEILVNEPEEEKIYLSYNQELPMISAPKIEPLNKPIAINPDLGHLALPSVIINKKNSRQAQVATAAVEQLQQSIAIQQEDLSYKILQGQRFNAVLTHAIHSDLPGMVVAELGQTIYGYQAYIPLLPKGTRLIGQYTNRLNIGDTRLYIAWDRAITPMGIDIQLGSLATDRLGQTGLGGDVDTHFWETFGTSSLLSVMAIGASNLSEEQGEFSNQYQQGVTDALMDTSTMVLHDRLWRKPTIHINQGEIIHVMVTQDLDFSKVLKTSQQIPVF